MNKVFYTYLHCTPSGEPFYVGKGCDSTSKRSHVFYISIETRLKLSIAAKNRIHSEETKQKISKTERLTKRGLKLNKELSC